MLLNFSYAATSIMVCSKSYLHEFFIYDNGVYSVGKPAS